MRGEEMSVAVRRWMLAVLAAMKLGQRATRDDFEA